MMNLDDAVAIRNATEGITTCCYRLKLLSKLVELDDPDSHARLWDSASKIEDSVVDILKIIKPLGVIG